MDSQGLERLSAYVSEALQHGPKPLGLPSEDLITAAAAAAEEVLMGQPPLLRIPAPVTVCGGLYANYEALWHIMNKCGAPPTTPYLFLGNYSSSGVQGVETLTLLFVLKALHPNHVFLLRGNNDCGPMSRIYGLYDQCKRSYSVQLWRMLCRTFDCLPLACIVADGLFCVNGGLSPELRSLKQIDDVHRPCDVPDDGLICDLLWAEPDGDQTGWDVAGGRSVSFTFGLDIVGAFLKGNGFEALVRSASAIEDGRDIMGAGEVISIASVGRFGGKAAVMHVDADRRRTFTIIEEAVEPER